MAEIYRVAIFKTCHKLSDYLLIFSLLPSFVSDDAFKVTQSDSHYTVTLKNKRYFLSQILLYCVEYEADSWLV